MYKNDREKLKKDNLNIRKAMQELVNQNYILKKQINVIEQQEEIHTDQKTDEAKEKLEFEVQRLSQDLNNELSKNKKWEEFSNELKISKSKSEAETKSVKDELNKLRQKVQELERDNSLLVREKASSQNRILKYQEEVNNLRQSQLSQPTPVYQETQFQQKEVVKSQDDFVNTDFDDTHTTKRHQPTEPQKEQTQIESVTQPPPVEQVEDNIRANENAFQTQAPQVAAPEPTQVPQNFENPAPKKEKQVISSSLFNTDAPSDLDNLVPTGAEPPVDLEPPQVRKQKLTSHPIGPLASAEAFPQNPMQRNTSHNFGGPAANDVASAEDFFENLGMLSMQNNGSDPSPAPLQQVEEAQPVAEPEVVEQQKDTPRDDPLITPQQPEVNLGPQVPALDLNAEGLGEVKPTPTAPQPKATPRRAKKVIPGNLFG